MPLESTTFVHFNVSSAQCPPWYQLDNPLVTLTPIIALFFMLHPPYTSKVVLSVGFLSKIKIQPSLVALS